MEPNKCAEWRWVSWDELKGDFQAQRDGDDSIKGTEEGVKKLFIPLLSLFEQRKGFEPVLDK